MSLVPVFIRRGRKIVLDRTLDTDFHSIVENMIAWSGQPGPRPGSGNKSAMTVTRVTVPSKQGSAFRGFFGRWRLMRGY